MFRSKGDIIGWGIIAVCVIAIGLTFAIDEGGADEGVCPHDGNYWRSVAPYTIRHGGNCYHVADRLREVYGAPAPGRDRWLVAQEIAALNDRQAGEYMARGTRLQVPIYRPTAAWFCGDIRNWHVAVIYGQRHDVSPALMVAIRTHENPKRSRDWYAYGVVCARGTDLRTQASWAARIVARIAGKQGWSPMEPTRGRVTRLGRIYTGTGSTHWGECVWAHMQKARGQR